MFRPTGVQGQDDWAKVGALAAIVEEAQPYIAAALHAHVEQRYIDAARALLQSANTDLNLICGATYQANRRAG